MIAYCLIIGCFKDFFLSRLPAFDNAMMNICTFVSQVKRSIYAIHSGFVIVGISTFALLLTAYRTTAQPPSDLRLEHITEEQGLSSSVVNGMFQDRDGMLWFATFDGINRYDGLKFRHFRHILPDSLSDGISTMRAIAQDYTGTLWIGSESKIGVSRFDSRTEVFNFITFPISATPLHIITIRETSDKTLWFGTTRGLFRLNRLSPTSPSNMSIEEASEAKDLRNEEIIALHEDGDSKLWIITRTSIYRLSKGTRIEKVWSVKQGVQITAASMKRDSSATYLWLGTAAHGVLCWNTSTQSEHALFTESQGMTSNAIRTILCVQNGSIWAGTDKGISIITPTRLFPQTHTITRVQTNRANPQSLSGNVVQALFEDASGVIWAAVEFYGLNKYAPLRNKFQRISSSFVPTQLALSSNYVRGIAETPTSLKSSSSNTSEQSTYLWVATQTAGLNRLNRSTGEWTYFRKDKFGSDTAWALQFDGKQTLWIGLVRGGLWSYNIQTQAMTRYSGIPAAATVQAIFLDKQGNVWVTGDKLPLTTFSPNNPAQPPRQYSITTSSGTNERVYCCIETRRGAFLVGTDKGLRELDRSAGKTKPWLSAVTVNALYEDASEALWIGTRGQGLWHYRPKNSSTSESTYMMGEREGLPSSIVSAILPDSFGKLWVSTKHGIVHIDPERRKILHLYDIDDGLQGNEFHRESAFASPKGELFFGGTNGLNFFKPGEMLANRTPPPILITSVKKSEREEILTDSTVHATKTIHLRHDENTLTFSFVALDYNSPEHNVYAYTLEGLDKGWIQSGNRREATYTSLEPGEYTFRVRAANNDGVWNEEGATMQIVIAPPIWRTWWFIGLSVASVICLGFVAYRARIRGIEAQNELLEKQVTMRTAELRTANVELQQINNKLSDSLNEIQILSSVLDGERNKSEDLLLNILPPSIAERLKWGETTIVDTFESATVLFSDMVGFTKIASRVSAEELIVMLNRMFSVFDQLAEVHTVEKIKTIGDAYMAVAGVPIPNEQHATAIALMALDMQLAIKELAETENLPISIRVGIHSGYLTAGVIGEKKFAYDLWGDTVNTASRMESSGEAGRVQCSEATYQLLKDTFDFEERGTIEVKGKGAMKTYFLLGQKA